MTFARPSPVTVFSHPRWGQAFLTDYSRLMALLATPSPDPETTTEADTREFASCKKYLEEPRVNAHVWDYLTQTSGLSARKSTAQSTQSSRL